MAQGPLCTSDMDIDKKLLLVKSQLLKPETGEEIVKGRRGDWGIEVPKLAPRSYETRRGFKNSTKTQDVEVHFNKFQQKLAAKEGAEALAAARVTFEAAPVICSLSAASLGPSFLRNDDAAADDQTLLCSTMGRSKPKPAKSIDGASEGAAGCGHESTASPASTKASRKRDDEDDPDFAQLLVGLHKTAQTAHRLRKDPNLDKNKNDDVRSELEYQID